MDQKSSKPSRLSWKAANQICAKRLIPFLPTLVEALDRNLAQTPDSHPHLSGLE
jgi:hypothetical protein